MPRVVLAERLNIELVNTCLVGILEAFSEQRGVLETFPIFFALMNISKIWDVGDFKFCMLNWFRYFKPFFPLAIFIPWVVWYLCNCAIFQEVKLI